LSPIECAVEALQKRVNEFRTEVYCTPVRKNNLQSLLLGTVAPGILFQLFHLIPILMHFNE
jgi:hypothetical protein